MTPIDGFTLEDFEPASTSNDHVTVTNLDANGDTSKIFPIPVP
jgi:hypothetical protein